MNYSKTHSKFLFLFILFIAIYCIVFSGGIIVYAANPTDINLSNNSINENLDIATIVADLSVIVEEDTKTYTFSLVDGEGSEDNLSFIIEGDQLKTNEVFNYEDKNKYNIRIKVDDGSEGSFEKSFVIYIENVNEGISIIEENPVEVIMDEDNSPTEFSLTLNAIDEDGDTIFWSIETQATSGTAFVCDTNTGTSQVISYQPNDNYNGDDNFFVKVSDENGETDTVLVNVNISPINDEPENTSLPNISGELFENETLSAIVGEWNDDKDGDKVDLSYTYQWQRANDSDGSGSVDIDGATSNTYVLTNDDNKKYIRVKVICEDSGIPDSTSAIAFSQWTLVGNHAPVITGENYIGVTMDEDGSPIPFSLVLNATDEDEDIITWSIETQASNGIASISETTTGTSQAIYYEPDNNFNGNDSFVVKIVDEYGVSDTITVNVNINPIDDAPSISDGSTKNIEFDEDELVYEFTLKTDEVEGDNITWTISSGAALGVASIEGTGTGTSELIRYSVDENINGSDDFIVSISDDDNGKEDTITVNVNINPVNDPPVNTVIPSFTGIMHNGETLTALSGEWNDSIDGNGPETISYTYRWQSADDTSGSGLIDIDNATGSSYTITENENNKYIRVKVTALDGGTPGNETTTAYSEYRLVTNDSPVILGDSIRNITISEDSNPVAFSLTLEATDNDGDTIDWSIKTQAISGTATVSGVGTSQAITYTPDEDYNGDDLFVVEVSDGNGGIDTVEVNVTIDAINDKPVNTSNPEISGIKHNGETLTASTGYWNDDKDNNSGPFIYTYQWQKADDDKGNGLVNIDGAIESTYKLTQNENDKYVRVEITCKDDGIPGATSEKAFSQWYLVENVAPIISEGNIKEIEVLEDMLDYTFDLNSTDDDGDIISWIIETQATSGTATIIGDTTGTSKTISYVPNEDYFGNDSFEIKAKDDNNGESIIIINVDVIPVNDVPSFAKGEDQTVFEDAEPQTINGWATDISKGPNNEDGQTLTFTLTTNNDDLFTEGGRPSINPSTGDLTYTLAENANGSATVSAILSDDGGISNSGIDTTEPQLFLINVTPVNDAPTMANIEDFEMDEDTTTSPAVIINDVDNNVNDLAISYETSDTALLPKSNISINRSDNDISINLEPVADLTGIVDVSITISDGAGLKTSQTFKITVKGVNDAPTIGDISDRTIDEDGTTGSIGLSVNDIDSDVNNLTLSAISNNTDLIDEEGIVFGGSGANRTITITPKDDMNGSADITVTIGDGSLSTNTSFRVNVQPVNDAPFILDLADVSAKEDTATGDISFMVSDIDDNEDTLEITVSASNTSMIPRANIELGGSGENRTLNLIPVSNKFGTSEITVTVKDDSGIITSDTFTLTVEAVNDDPTISSIGSQVTNEDQTKSISFTIGDVDDDYVDLTLLGSSNNPEIVTNSGITFSGTGSTRTVNITPGTNKSGEAVITLTITDQGGLTSQSIFALTVNSVNDNPSFTKGENQIKEEDCGYQNIEGWATNMSAGPNDEYGQELSFIVTNDNNSLFEVQPSISTIGELSYTPAKDANGIANVSVKLSDGGDVNSLSATQTFTIEITEVNDKPIAKEMIITLNTDEDKSYKGNLRASDIENDSLTYEIVSNGSKGIVEITNSCTGAFTYTPGVNQYGEDSFTFKVKDGEFYSDVATITAIIQGVNDPPVATGGNITTDEDVDITAMLSASDVDNETLVYTIVQQPDYGDISLDTNTGKYTYTPDSNVNGSDNFTFKVSDGELNSNTASMLITINPINDKPLATGETIELNEDQQLNGILKANDIENDSLTYNIITAPLNGTLVLNNSSTGIYTYTPNDHFSGTDTFKFKVNDGLIDSDIATVIINVSGINHVPTINDPIVVNINEDESYTGNFVASDPDGDLVTYSIVSPTMYGTINIDNTTDGAFTYIPRSDFNGKDIATYKVYDGEYYSDIVIATFNVNPVNDIPEAYTQYIDTDLNTPIDVNLIAYDRDGDNLTYKIEDGPSYGTIVITGSACTYTPKTDCVGQDTFTFKVNDGESDSNIATVVIHVNGEGGSGAYGITVLDKITMDQDTTTTATFSIEGYDNVSVTAISSNFRLIDNSGINITNKSGNDYEIELTPKQAKYGFSIIRVEARGDGDGQSDIDTFILEVNRVEHPPVANNKEINMDENTILNEFVTGSDYNGDSLIFGKTSDPIHGSLSFYTDRIFIYTPNENYFGTDSFRFKAIDSRNYESEDATVTINIRKVSMAPIASNSAIETNEDTTYSGNLVGYDIHGEEINFEIVNTGVHGVAEVTNAANGAFSYTPNENYNGSDYFTFKIRNENGLWSSIARVDVIINPVNDVPVAVAPVLNTDEDQLITGFLKGTDVEKSALTFEIVDEPNKGTISLIEETGAFTYNPNLNENGSEEFTFKAKESDDIYSTATAIITINPVNDAPEAEETTITIYEDTTTSGALNFLVSDVDNGDIQTFELIKNGNKGTASITTSGEFTYIPNGDVNGIGYFTFKTRDSSGLYSNVDRVTVDIIPVNDEPSMFDPSTWTINEDSINNKYYFTVGDIEDIDGTLSVGGISNNTDLIPNENISFGGTEGDRWINVTPIDTVTGTAIITINTTDSGIDSTITGDHLSASTTLTITVVDVDDTPTINDQSTNNKAITSTITIDEDTSTGAISFTVDDEESGGNLTVTGSSNNSTLVKTDGILFGGEGNSRTINIIPEPDKYGNARITVSASDGNTSRTAYIDLIVKPVNDEPIVNPPANQIINEDSSTEVLYFTISDIDSDVEDINMTAVSLDESIVLSTNIIVGGNGEERTVKVIPAKDANGDVNIKLIADDGEAIDPTGSGIFTVHINPVNDKPSIENISNQTIDEDTSTSQIAITIDDIDTLSENLTLSAILGNTSLINTDGITFGGSEGNRWIVLKPIDDQYGSGLITVIVSDGAKTSSTSFNLAVNPVNDAPSISNILDQQIFEDGSTNTITFTVGDIDNDVTELSIVKISADEEVIPTDNIVTVGNGAERTVKITPVPNENGSIDIELIVKDTDNLTSSSIFTVDIVPINDVPSFTVGANQISNEDDEQQTVTGWAIGINKGFKNEDGQELTFVTSTNNNDLFSQLPSVDGTTGNLMYTAAENANGVATVTIYLKDDGGTTNGGIDTTSSQTFTITVDSVNDVPSFTKGVDQVVNEDAGTKVVNGWATAISKGPDDESAQTLTFNVTTDNDSLFATDGKPVIDANGNLTYTPADNANGNATVTVALSDNGGTERDGVDTSDAQTFTITVNSVNDAPIFSIAGNQEVNEDSGTKTVNGFLSGKDEGGETDENTQTLEISITTNNDSLFATEGKPTINLTSGDLTYTLADDANGVATVTVTLSDDGGTTSGGIDVTTKEFTITVLPVNDVPSFTKGLDQTALEDVGAQTVNGWATDISKGSINEDGQTLTFTVTTDDESLFETDGKPAIDSSGNLTYTPVDDANGSTSVTVTLSDNGGTDRGGVDATLAQTFTINITPVNDEPTFTATNQTVNEDSGLQTVTGWAGSMEKGPLDENGQTLTFKLIVNDESLFSQQPSVDTNGNLTYIPASNAYGSTTITAILSDDGGTANGGDNISSQTFTITINSVNDVPSFTKGTDQIVNEDVGVQTINNWASNISKGADKESEQSLTFELTGFEDELFTTDGKPAVDANGTLTYTPAADVNGSTTVTAIISDDGGTEREGVDTSTSQSFVITIKPVNDIPIFTIDIDKKDQTVNEDSAATTVEDFATNISEGAFNEENQELSFTLTGYNEKLFTTDKHPSIDANGTLTYTPAPNVNGSTTVTVVLKDDGDTINGGEDTTLSQTFDITIDSVNDAPEFNILGDQEVNEDSGSHEVSNFSTDISHGGGNDESSQTLEFTTENDNNSLFSVQPIIEPNGTLKYTLAGNEYGTAKVTVILKDNGGAINGGVDTTTKSFQIVVNPVNDIPSFIKGEDNTSNEDSVEQTINGWATSISKGPNNESDQLLTFITTTDNDSLFTADGKPKVDESGNLTYTAAEDSHGETLVTIYLKDDGGTTNGGIDTTSSQTFKITVNSVNDVPSFAKGTDQTINEDAGAQTINGWATDISKGPNNENNQELTFNVTTNNDDLFATGPVIDTNGDLTYTPADNVYGETIIKVTLSDDGGTTNGGIDTTSSQTFNITVNSVNDVPSFTKGTDQTINEDAGAQTINGWATDISKGPNNENNQELTFNVTTNNDDLFATGPSIDTNGDLTYTPADNVYGEAIIKVTLSDDGGTTNGGIDTTLSQTFKITVNSVNDVPSFTKGSDQTVNEDAGEQTINNWATNISKGPSNEDNQTLTFNITTDNDDLFAKGPAIDSAGNLTYTPENNANGTVAVTVTLSDNGGIANGGIDTTSSQTFKITVNSVNDVPSFTKGTDQTINEDAGAQTINGWATDISKGPDNESSQTLTFNVTTNNEDLFATGPSIDSNGNLTYTPENDANGTVVVTVTLSDDGGTTNGGIDTTLSQTFKLTVNSVNDVPSFTKGSDQTVNEDAGEQTINNWVTNISKGPSNEDNQTLTFNITTDNDDLFAKGPAIDSAGNLTYTPENNANGTVAVTVTLSDNGGIANGGTDTTSSQSFTIKVISVVDRIMIIEGELLNAVTKEKIIDAEVNLLDLSGEKLFSTISLANGTYEFRNLSEGRYIVQVIHPEYSHNSRMTEVSFDKNKLGVITEDFLMADFTLELVANPTAILGNGKDISVLTAVVKDRNGLPISNVDLDFYAESGKLLGENIVNTDDNGEATIQYKSDKLSGTDALVIPVTVSVNNPERNLYGTDQIFVTFAPGFIEGIVTDGTTSGSAIEGAIVTVYKDFDGDGITDFSFAQITGADGRYKIAIPKGNVEYEISITKPVLVGDKVQNVTFKQNALAGDISGIGNEQYKSEKVATGVIIVKNSDGSSEIMNKDKLCSELKMEIVYPDDSVQAIGDDNIDDSTGVFSSESLNPGNYDIVVKHDLGDGNEIIVGRTEVTITEDGEVNINEILIDPYGTVTKKGTNTVIPGVDVKLYYADTDRNTKAGKIQGTMVVLPEILGFKPANNANPQQTDDNGNYAFMVFPNTDYYIIANKLGYRTHTSETISVDDEIVLYNFEMSRISKHNPVVIDPSVPSTEEKDLAISIKSEKMKIEDEKEFNLIVDYINKSDVVIEDVTIKVTIPEEIEIINAGDGVISDKIINWHFDSLASGEVGKIEINVKSLNQDKAEKYLEISTNITSSNELISLQDDYSMIKVLIYSNQFTMTHKRYIKGYPDGTFRPSNSITRAEVAAMFARLLDLDVSNKITSYNDVESEHWALGYINAVSDANLMNGYQDGTFAADKPITRAEFSTIIARYFGIERDNNIEPIKLHFNDITNNWAMSNIEEIYRFGIVNGYNDGTFKPQSAILRTEAVTMINRMLYRGPVNSDISQFNDVERNDWYFGNVEESSKTHEYIINEDGSETIIRWIDDFLK